MDFAVLNLENIRSTANGGFYCKVTNDTSCVIFALKKDNIINGKTYGQGEISFPLFVGFNNFAFGSGETEISACALTEIILSQNKELTQPIKLFIYALDSEAFANSTYYFSKRAKIKVVTDANDSLEYSAYSLKKSIKLL